MKSLILICTTLLLFNVDNSYGETITWTGGVDEFWHEPDNWDLKRVPLQTDDVIIEGVTVRVGVTASVKTLTMRGAYLIVNGALLLYESLSGTNNLNIEDNSELLITKFAFVRVQDSVRISKSRFVNLGLLEPATSLVNPAENLTFILDLDNLLFHNTGTIRASNFISSADFTNDGEIIAPIRMAGRVTNNGTMIGSIHLYASSRLNNIGVIKIEDMINGQIYVELSSELENQGSILFNHVSGFNSNSLLAFVAFIVHGRFENSITGSVVMNDISVASEDQIIMGMYFTDHAEFDNYGYISIDSIPLAIGSAAVEVVNHASGTINISNAYAGAGRGIALGRSPSLQFLQFPLTTNGVFINDGEIDIIGCVNYGIYMYNDFSFINNRQLNIEVPDLSVGAAGGIGVPYNEFGILSNVLINNIDASIDISNSDEPQLYTYALRANTSNFGTIHINGFRQSAMEGILENHGVVNVLKDQSGSQGSTMRLQQLDNKSGAVVNCDGLMISYEGNILYGNSINEGEINILSGWLQLFQNEELGEQHFINRPCGVINSDMGLIIEEGNIMENEGVLILNYNVNNVQMLRDSLYNAGVISLLHYDPDAPSFAAHYNLADLSEFYNEGVYIHEVDGNYNCGEMISDVSSGSNSAGIPSPLLTVDEESMISGGFYDLPNNSITLGAHLDGVDMLYAHFEMSNNCTRIVPISLENILSCMGCDLNIWDGSSSTDWHTPANWSLNSVPTSCQNVVIPINSNCVIALGNIAECRQIEISTMSDLDINGQLNVVGN